MSDAVLITLIVCITVFLLALICLIGKVIGVDRESESDVLQTGYRPQKTNLPLPPPPGRTSN